MQLLKFLFSIVLVELLTVVLVLLNIDDLNGAGYLKLGIPLLFIALIVAFWFSSLSGHYHKDELEKVKSKFAKEKEELRVNAEQDKLKVVKEAQKDIAKEVRNTHAKANFKVGASFAGVMGVGVLFVFAQMITAGLLTLTAVGGVMGGYYWRGKKEEEKKLLANGNQHPIEANVIESRSSKFSLPFNKEK